MWLTHSSWYGYRSLFLALGCLTVGTLSFADPLWTSISPGARHSALADADTAIPANEDGIFHNPAALADLTSNSVRAQTVLGLEEVRGAGLGLLVPTQRIGTWGIHLNNATAGTMDVNPADPSAPTTTVDAQSEIVGSAAWGGSLQRLSPRLLALSLGVAARYFREEVAESGAETGQAVDVGAQYRFLKKRAALGLAFQNLGGKIGEDDLPRLWSAGGSYILTGNQIHRGLIDVDLARLANEESSPRLGVEYYYRSILTLRCGLALRGKGNEDRWAAGLGVRLPVGSNRLNLDYAYRSAGDLGGVHAMDLTWRWSNTPQKTSAASKNKTPVRQKVGR